MQRVKVTLPRQRLLDHARRDVRWNSPVCSESHISERLCRQRCSCYELRWKPASKYNEVNWSLPVVPVASGADPWPRRSPSSRESPASPAQNDASRISRRPSWVSPWLSKVPRRLLALRTLRDNRVSPGVTEERCTEEDPCRSKDVGHVGDGSSLARERSWQAIETPLSAAESNGPWTGSGLHASASMVVMSRRCNRRDA
jgi:hypothetical protein